MAEATFTCFPNLPLEIRSMIWHEVANLPRNLDLWARTIGAASWQWTRGGPASDIELFRFTTTQPNPAILAVNREARKIGKLYYEISFGQFYDIDDPDIKITTPGTVLRNFEADRICPMGRYGENPHLELWCSVPPPSCAINLYVPSERSHLPAPLSRIFRYADGVHDEILLYYSKGELPSGTQFDFVEITEEEEKLLPPDERLALRTGSNDIRDDIEKWNLAHKEYIKAKFKRDGIKVPKDEDIEDACSMPRIKTVALVINGERPD
ncbi:hypothetical protein B0J14DRAFT_696555 [Halenospora varia]|nr:hypothetical protein B0J14DRAFT_696555 [Halenospora varia]